MSQNQRALKCWSMQDHINPDAKLCSLSSFLATIYKFLLVEGKKNKLKSHEMLPDEKVNDMDCTYPRMQLHKFGKRNCATTVGNKEKEKVNVNLLIECSSSSERYNST